MVPTDGNVERLLSALDALLATAAADALRAANNEKPCVLVAPEEVEGRVRKAWSHGLSSFNSIEEASAHLQESGRADSIDLIIVFHPAHRIVPAIWQHGYPFRLSSALDRDDRVWLIRPQSFFLQLLEDEYLLFPQT